MADLHTEVLDLIKRQLESWPMAKGNFEALGRVESKRLDVDGWDVGVQFNPARAVSSGAKVDAAAIKARPCFLCEANRPKEQEALMFENGGHRYEVLINPFPIFPHHLTIPSVVHEPQRIKGRVADMMSLAEQLQKHTIFYNGPRCGASAPDHMHFQAGDRALFNIDSLILSEDGKAIAHTDNAELLLYDKGPLRFFTIICSPDNLDEAEQLFSRLYAAMPVPEGEEEPMMNVLAYRVALGVVLVVIPRKRHRPSFYGTEGEGKMMLSPASVDMGGLFITPREADFRDLDADTVRQVFDELTLSTSEIDKIAQNVK